MMALFIQTDRKTERTETETSQLVDSLMIICGNKLQKYHIKGKVMLTNTIDGSYDPPKVMFKYHGEAE